jgi:hypothetical protein
MKSIEVLGSVLFLLAVQSSRTAVAQNANPQEQPTAPRQQTKPGLDAPKTTFYHDPFLGISVVAPPGWTIVPLPKPFPDGQIRINYLDPENQAAEVAQFARPADIEPSEIDAWLSEQVLKMGHGEGLERFTVRPESIRRYPIPGGRGQRAIADYVENGQKKIEVMTWFRTDGTRSFLRARGVDPANLDSFTKRFQPLVDNIVLPRGKRKGAYTAQVAPKFRPL